MVSLFYSFKVQHSDLSLLSNHICSCEQVAFWLDWISSILIKLSVGHLVGT